MKTLFNKITNIPTQYIIIVALVSFVLTVALFQGTVTPGFAIGVILLGMLLAAQMTIGSIVIKSILTAFIVLYLTATYTSAVTEFHDKVVEPFLFTIAAITVFLAQSYSAKNVNFNLRSRPLWTFILAFTLVSLKLTMILSNYSFLMSELIGLYYLIIFIIIWRIWLKNSKKTKVVEPKIISKIEQDGLLILTMEDELDIKNSKWSNYKNENAYPFVFSEVVLANEKKLKLVLVSNSSTEQFYDVQKVRINKSKEIPYMYIKAKNDKYLKDALERFKTEEK